MNSAFLIIIIDVIILGSNLFQYGRQKDHIIRPDDQLIELKHLLPHLPNNRLTSRKAALLNKPQYIIRQLRQYNAT